MKFLKNYATFLNESAESKIDEIISLQKSIPSGEHHSYTKDDLCAMGAEDLENALLDVKSILKSFGEEDVNFIQSPYNPNLPSDVASGKIKA